MKLRLIPVLLAFSSALPAEPPAGKNTFSVEKMAIAPFEVKGFTVGKKLVIDEAYAAKHGGPPVETPFQVIIPKRDHTFVLFPPQSGQAHIKLNFATADKHLVENLQFVNMKIPLGDPNERLAAAAQLLMQRGLPMAFKGYQNPKHLETYRHKVGTCDAVTVHGQVTDPAKGLFYVKLTGILNPDAETGTMGFAMLDAKRAGIKTPNDLRTQGIANKIIHSLKFVPKK